MTQVSSSPISLEPATFYCKRIDSQLGKNLSQVFKDNKHAFVKQRSQIAINKARQLKYVGLRETAGISFMLMLYLQISKLKLAN